MSPWILRCAQNDKPIEDTPRLSAPLETLSLSKRAKLLRHPWSGIPRHDKLIRYPIYPSASTSKACS